VALEGRERTRARATYSSILLFLRSTLLVDYELLSLLNGEHLLLVLGRLEVELLLELGLQLTHDAHLSLDDLLLHHLLLLLGLALLLTLLVLRNVGVAVDAARRRRSVQRRLATVAVGRLARCLRWCRDDERRRLVVAAVAAGRSRRTTIRVLGRRSRRARRHELRGRRSGTRAERRRLRRGAEVALGRGSERRLGRFGAATAGLQRGDLRR